jgi:hypothetical protein
LVKKRFWIDVYLFYQRCRIWITQCVENFPDLVSNKLKGADKLTEYFLQFSTHAPDFNFDLSRTTFNKDENKMVMHGHLDNTDIEIDSNFQFNEYGKFLFISINYPNNK